ncbi:acetate uptake transporter [Lederbergia citrea]|uniref:Acetate uptake transporter n=1 Tax=Lederbergia citrea TaxID=2833581 RepID=A0A942UPZ2_9BACI|nr:acetate uptake transporter [Lederbergia citrea]MBS4179184.1 acetate uptake transporter [Lederbergia citrea]MBS4205847.1 acetate uptake transporter [Lederbergia citrea]MBS4224705.1 acetate uptake transporter [Lederbergia citrea]
MDTQNHTQVKITTADPSAIGLFGLAMVTLVASSQKLGITEGFSYLLPWVFFLGGLAQVYASVLDAKLNNIFGTTAFGAYGLFWLGIGTTWLIQLGFFGEKLATDGDIRQLGFAFIGYLIFSIFMTIGAMETNKLLFIIFVFIDFLFIGLSLSSFNILYNITSMLAAIAELCIALLSFYGSAANVLNTHFGRIVLPIGKPFGIFKK